MGGYTGTGNINSDPYFVNASSNDYRLSNYSAIGAGTTSGSPATDINGVSRPSPSGSSPDMGAYENSRSYTSRANEILRIYFWKLQRMGISGDPMSSLQDAINTAGEGDTILVAAGTYVAENEPYYGNGQSAGPNFYEKTGITVIGENPANTIVDLNGNSYGFIFSRSCSNIVIKGLTIKNGGYAIISSFNSSTGIEFSECVLVVEDENYLMESYEGTYFFNNCTFIGPNGNNEPYVFYDANQINVTNSIFSGFGGIANIGVDISHCLFNKMQIDSNQDISGTNNITRIHFFVMRKMETMDSQQIHLLLDLIVMVRTLEPWAQHAMPGLLDRCGMLQPPNLEGLTPMMDRKLLRF